MTNDELKKIIENNQSLVAEKYKIGSSLVTGHKKSYFDESTKLAMIDFAILELEKLEETMSDEENHYALKFAIERQINELKKQKEEL